MKPIAAPQTSHVILLSFLFFAFLCLIDGCKDDSSSPTIAPYPDVAGQWSGVVSQGQILYDCTFWITQNVYKLSGSSLWTMRSNGNQTRTQFTGTINTDRQLALQETSYVALNWSGIGWALASYTGRVNTKGDSLYLTWMISGGSTGDFVLVKQ